MLERVSLFASHQERLIAFGLTFLLFLLSLSLEFAAYKRFTTFDSALVNAKVMLQYTKSKPTKKGKIRTYQVLKLKSDSGLTFYTIASKNLHPIKGKRVEMEIWAGSISFYEYLRTFFAYGKILNIYEDDSLRERVAAKITSQHQDTNISSIYNALFLAKPLERDLQTHFSSLGVSHLIAISGFHLGVLSGVLFFLLRLPYKTLQERYFPFRSYKRDVFIIIAFILLSYMLFIGSPPSLIRAFGMLVVGFVLYDRGIEIISMQTLFVTLLLLLALFPTLIFSLGFWLSAFGVFYIFLFLIHFKDLSGVWQFFLLPIWVYLMMLPFSLAIFGNFSTLHPLSVLWTELFVLFYPLSLFLHLVGFGDLLDFALHFLLHLAPNASLTKLPMAFLILELLLSLIGVFKRSGVYALVLLCSGVFIYFIYDVAEF